jgi:hypothetical protein
MSITTRKVRVVVVLEIKDNADCQEILEECDYSFDHPDIIDTEIEGEID